MYVANSGSNNVSAYTITGGTGVLTPASGSPFAAGTAPSFLTVDATDQFLFVANQGSSNISAFSVTVSTGALSSISGSPFGIGVAPSWITTTN